MEQPSFYAILPAYVRYDNRLKAAEKILFAEITALTSAKGYCYASNAYFCELYGVAQSTARDWIASLKKYGYIEVDVRRDSTGNVTERRITTAVKLPCTPSTEKPAEGYAENPVEASAENPVEAPPENRRCNNTSLNTTRKNKESEKAPRPSSVDEVRAYCQERGNGVNPDEFFDFYESKGWIVGKSPMKDWKAAVRTWEQKNGRGPKNGGTQNNDRRIVATTRL